MKNFYDHCDRCDECGKFVSYKDPVISYTSYGGYYDMEPPDDDHICEKCWDNMNESRKNLIDRIAWVKPHYIRKQDCSS